MNENNTTIEPTLYVYNPGNGLNINNNEGLFSVPIPDSNIEVEQTINESSVSVPIPEPLPLPVPIDIIPESIPESTQENEPQNISPLTPENNQTAP